MDLELKHLQVSNLDLDCGAADTTVEFAEYPTKVSLDTGSSTSLFKFPEGYGVKVIVDGGATSVNLNGFARDDDTYTSPGYDEDGDNIIIEVNAGAARLTPCFIE